MWLVWDDGFGRHREEVTFVNQTSQDKTFQDADGQMFTVVNAQIVSMDEKLQHPDGMPHDGYQEQG